jgi:hypothetical protein
VKCIQLVNPIQFTAKHIAREFAFSEKVGPEPVHLDPAGQSWQMLKNVVTDLTETIEQGMEFRQ